MVKPKGARRTRQKTEGTVPTKQQILDFLAGTTGEAGKREIARAFGVKGGDRIALKSLLREMANDGLIAGSRRKLTRPGVLPAVTVLEITGRDADGEFMRSDAAFRTPQLIELDKIYAATRAVEQGSESETDLKYLQGKATSLGGLRPKCTVLDSDGTLALGKFPSITDTRSIVRGEVLALKLAKLASR